MNIVRRALRQLARRLYANAIREEAIDLAQEGPSDKPVAEHHRRLFIREAQREADQVEAGLHDQWVFGPRRIW